MLAIQPEVNSAMMNALSNNPELFRTMMQSNPMMTRLMESNPQLAQALNNPEVLRDAARAISSPVCFPHTIYAVASLRLVNLYITHNLSHMLEKVCVGLLLCTALTCFL